MGSCFSSASRAACTFPSVNNSIVVSSWTTVISLVLGTPAAYSFARLDVPWKRALPLFIYGAKTLPVVLFEFVGRFSIDWGLMTTGGLVATLPRSGLV
ncbi:MAG TPA: hypothetical protein GX506_08055 [Firmicutes bacterium]|nr:hypothetical protein [Bacillota bacterium]